MSKCIFCGQDLEEKKLFHDTQECKKAQRYVNDSLFNRDRITVGMATCGLSAGAKTTHSILSSSNLSMPVEVVGCSGMCYNEPIVTVMQNQKFSIYRDMTAARTNELVLALKDNNIHKDCYIGEKLEDIDFFKHQKRVIMKRCGTISPLDLKQYLITTGFNGLVNALHIHPEKVIQNIKDSGLRGRGGAGFSTGLKWEFLSKAKDDKYLIINADEGDPGAFMNRTLMESDPYQVLEGMIIAAYATQTKEGIVYTRAEYPLAIETLQKAIDTLIEHNILGKSILGINGFDFNIRIMKGAGAFVCGEETSLMKSIEGKRGHPRPRPPYPAVKGVYDKPSNINNVETYAHAANIMSNGVDEYKQSGTESSHGTKCICITGKIKNSGVIEIELGTPLHEIIYNIGGGIKNNKKFKALQSGGPSGGCIIESELHSSLDYDSMQELGTIMGSGGLVVMDEDDCMVDVAKFFLTFTTDESCGKCVPCREGTKRMLELVQKISRGLATEEDLDKLNKLAAVIKDTALCGLGQSAPNPVLSTIEKFHDEYMAHIKDKNCPTKKCIELLRYFITDKCVGCGNCEKHCPVGAITGKLKEKYIIDQDKCIKCGKCYKACAFKAIIKK